MPLLKRFGYTFENEIKVTLGGIKLHGHGANITKIECGTSQSVSRCFSSSFNQKATGEQVFLESIKNILFTPGYVGEIGNVLEFGGAFFINGISHSVNIQNVVFSGFSS